MIIVLVLVTVFVPDIVIVIILVLVLLVVVGTTIPPLPEPDEVFPRKREPGGGATRLRQA
jgi:hypothetical protein